jgi:phospholipid/cholesterol/gamma-HCH transport system substrate-binding protein
MPAPSINSGLNPLAAELLPTPTPPAQDPLSAPGTGSVVCNGQQPNPCVYTPASASATNTSAANASATYDAQSGEIVGPDGTTYTVTNSTNTGDDGWKEMLAPAS